MTQSCLRSVLVSTQVSAVPFLWPVFLRDARQAAQPFYSALMPATAPAGPPMQSLPRPCSSGDAPRQLQLPQPARLREAAVAAAVAEAVRAALDEDVGSSAPLMQAGLDSLGE